MVSDTHRNGFVHQGFRAGDVGQPRANYVLTVVIVAHNGERLWVDSGGHRHECDGHRPVAGRDSGVEAW
eukprot:1384412-Amorphochlora_amoeboformis.AAC.1